MWMCDAQQAHAKVAHPSPSSVIDLTSFTMMATLGQGGANSGERRHNGPESKVRLISYEVAGRFRAGLVLGRDVVDAHRAATAAGLDGGLDWSSARVVLSAPPTQRQLLLTSASQI